MIWTRNIFGYIFLLIGTLRLAGPYSPYDIIGLLISGIIFFILGVFLVKHKGARLSLGIILIIMGLWGLICRSDTPYNSPVYFGYGFFIFNLLKPVILLIAGGYLVGLKIKAKKLKERFKSKPGTEPPKPGKQIVIIPREALVYEKNAFRLLGLDTTASLISLNNNRGDAVNTLQIGFPVPYPIIPLPNNNPINDEWEIENAFARVQDNRIRLKEELFWFWDYKDDYQEVKSWLNDGFFQRVRERWQEIADTNGWALHNLAVLEHAWLIGEEKQSVIFRTKEWQEIYRTWKQVHENRRCYDYFTQRMIDLNHPQINEAYIDNLWNEIPGRVLEINIKIAEANVNINEDYAKKHLDLIRNSGFPQDLVENTIGYFFKQDNDKFNNLRQNIANLPENDVAAIKAIINEGVETIEKGKRLGGENFLIKTSNLLVDDLYERIKNYQEVNKDKVYQMRNVIMEEPDQMILQANSIINLMNQMNQSELLLNYLLLKDQLSSKARVLKDQLSSKAREAVRVLENAKKRGGELKNICKEADKNLKESENLLSEIRKLCLINQKIELVEGRIRYTQELKQEFKKIYPETMTWIDKNLEIERRNI